jgi:hypothetical protein
MAARRAACETTRGGDSIHVAAQDGDSEALLRCLSAGLSIDARNKRQHTPLMFAAEHGHVDLVRLLLSEGADVDLTNAKRMTAREIASRRLQQSGRGRRESNRTDIEDLLVDAEARQGQNKSRPCREDGSGMQRQSRCPVCGEKIRPRQRVDFLRDDGQSRYVSNFLQSNGLRRMRSHPHHHYHSLLETRQLHKEVSESWGLLAAVHDLIAELQVDPRDLVLFDLCSGKGLTAVCMALEFPRTSVIAVDIISRKCLPHTTDLTNLRYIEADLFTCAPLLIREMAPETGRKPRTGILVGSHLCGRLSVQAVELFHSLSHVAAFVLSPCCWPRRKDYNSTDDELAELAGLMWLKATTTDTYTTWSQHLWRLLAAPTRPAPVAGCSGRRGNASNGASALGRSALHNRYVQQAIGFEGHTASREAATGPVQATPQASCKPAIAVGLKRDPEVLSEKNALITAVKKRDCTHDVAAWHRHAKGAQRR